MTSPVETITVKCPRCSHLYEDWRRASINLSLGEDFSDDYIHEAMSAMCPACGLRVDLADLVVREGEELDSEIWEAQPKAVGISRRAGERHFEPFPVGALVRFEAKGGVEVYGYLLDVWAPGDAVQVSIDPPFVGGRGEHRTFPADEVISVYPDRNQEHWPDPSEL